MRTVSQSVFGTLRKSRGFGKGSRARKGDREGPARGERGTPGKHSIMEHLKERLVSALKVRDIGLEKWLLN